MLSGLRRLARNKYLDTRVRQNNLTGKSLLIFGSCVKPGNEKYFAFTEDTIRGIFLAIPSCSGALAIVTNVGRVAVDATVATDERSLSVR
jgi:hypothetical protein